MKKSQSRTARVYHDERCTDAARDFSAERDNDSYGDAYVRLVLFQHVAEREDFRGRRHRMAQAATDVCNCHISHAVHKSVTLTKLCASVNGCWNTTC